MHPCHSHCWKWRQAYTVGNDMGKGLLHILHKSSPALVDTDGCLLRLHLDRQAKVCDPGACCPVLLVTLASQQGPIQKDVISLDMVTRGSAWRHPHAFRHHQSCCECDDEQWAAQRSHGYPSMQHADRCVEAVGIDVGTDPCSLVVAVSTGHCASIMVCSGVTHHDASGSRACQTCWKWVNT